MADGVPVPRQPRADQRIDRAVSAPVGIDVTDGAPGVEGHDHHFGRHDDFGPARRAAHHPGHAVRLAGPDAVDRLADLGVGDDLLVLFLVFGLVGDVGHIGARQRPDQGGVVLLRRRRIGRIVEVHRVVHDLGRTPLVAAAHRPAPVPVGQLAKLFQVIAADLRRSEVRVELQAGGQSPRLGEARRLGRGGAAGAHRDRHGYESRRTAPGRRPLDTSLHSQLQPLRRPDRVSHRPTWSELNKFRMVSCRATDPSSSTDRIWPSMILKTSHS